jgi:hypothetical protein
MVETGGAAAGAEYCSATVVPAAAGALAVGVATAPTDPLSPKATATPARRLLEVATVVSAARAEVLRR